MLLDIGIEEYQVKPRYPDTVYKADKESVKEILSGTVFCDEVSTHHENYQPACRLYHHGYQGNGCKGHCQSEE
jgi:hypothetical protein